MLDASQKTIPRFPRHSIFLSNILRSQRGPLTLAPRPPLVSQLPHPLKPPRPFSRDALHVKKNLNSLVKIPYSPELASVLFYPYYELKFEGILIFLSLPEVPVFHSFKWPMIFAGLSHRGNILCRSGRVQAGAGRLQARLVRSCSCTMRQGQSHWAKPSCPG